MAKTGSEHELVRILTLEALLGKGWNRDQISCPSSDSEDAEWRVPQSPHDASKREQGLSFKSWPVDLVIFDSPEHVGEWDHVFGIFEFKAPDIEAGRSQLEVYMNREPRCRFGYWTNGGDSVAVFKLADGQDTADAGDTTDSSTGDGSMCSASEHPPIPHITNSARACWRHKPKSCLRNPSCSF